MLAIFESIRAFGEVFLESIKKQNLIDIVWIFEHKIMVEEAHAFKIILTETNRPKRIQ